MEVRPSPWEPIPATAGKQGKLPSRAVRDSSITFSLMNSCTAWRTRSWRNGGQVPHWLTEAGITITNGTGLLRECVNALTGADPFPRLRIVTMGGDTSTSATWNFISGICLPTP